MPRPRVQIMAGPIEGGVFKEQHAALDAELERAGFIVLRESELEHRGALPPADVLYGAFSAVISLTERAADYAGYLLTIEEIVRRVLRGRIRRRSRTVGILGPDGTVLRRVEIDDDDQAA